MSEKKKLSISDKVLKELKKTGLPTEMKVNDILTKKSWDVYHNEPYIDPESKKVRTIDFRAEKIFPFKPEDRPVQLFIECKKGSASWVFFVDSSFENRLRRTGFDLGSRVRKIKMRKKERGLDFVFFNRGFFEPMSFTYQVLFKKGNFFNEALMQVLNSIQMSPFVDEPTFYSRLYPVVIYDGPLFTCTYKDKIWVKKTDHIKYVSGGIPSNPTPTVIEVMTLDYFPTYLENLKPKIAQPSLI